MPYLSKKPSKLLNVLGRKQEAENLHEYENKINNSLKNMNLLVDQFILKYLLFFSLWSTKKKKKKLYICLWGAAAFHLGMNIK